MIWPGRALPGPPRPEPPSGYAIRTYQPGDEAPFLSLMAAGDFDPWDEEKVQFNRNRVLPGGWFFAVVEATGEIVATAMCLHNYTGTSPFTGDVGWLACDPAHRGRGLGMALMIHVTRRFLDAGYTRIQLHTEHYRLAAIAIYLKLGYVPVLETASASVLWQELCERIHWTYTPDRWPKGENHPGVASGDDHLTGSDRGSGAS